MKYIVYFTDSKKFITRSSLVLIIIRIFLSKDIAYIGIDTEGLEK